MPRINLIPWRESERKRKRQEFGVGAVGALVVAGAIAFLVNLQMQSAIDGQNERNQYLKGEIANLDKQIAEILELDAQKQRLLARMQVIEQLERSRPEIVHVFDQLVRTIPDGVYLTSLKQADRKLELKGMAQSSTRVASYMRNIDSSEWLADPALDILETKGAGDAGSEFTLNATQENPQIPANAETVAANGGAR
jgi:type IV pilus assembly protein PilN